MNKSSKAALAFLIGATAGAVAGILFAPDSGVNTRNKLYYRLSKYREQLSELLDNIGKGKELPDALANSESDKVVEETKKKAEKLLLDVESMMAQIKEKA